MNLFVLRQYTCHNKSLESHFRIKLRSFVWWYELTSVFSYSADSSSVLHCFSKYWDIFKITNIDIHQQWKRWLKDFNIEFSEQISRTDPKSGHRMCYVSGIFYNYHLIYFCSEFKNYFPILSDLQYKSKELQFWTLLWIKFSNRNVGVRNKS
jgi:hypothetical protein